MARALACLRYFLVGGAIVVGICGLVESAFAGYFVYQFHEYAPLTPNDVCGPPSVLVAMGLVTCIIGCWAWQFLDFTNFSQVILFVVVLSGITAVELGAGIWALVRHEQVDALPPAHLKQVLETAGTDHKPVWDRMHARLSCCGADGPTDYRGQDAIPWSCCDTTPSLNASDNKGTCTSVYARGCHYVVINRTRSVLLHVFLLSLCTVLLQVCFIACTIFYTRACKEKQRRRQELHKSTLLSREPRYSKAACDSES